MALKNLMDQDQHKILHQQWPNDCCLCRTEKEIERLRAENETLRAENEKQFDAHAEWADKIETENTRFRAKNAKLKESADNWEELFRRTNDTAIKYHEETQRLRAENERLKGEEEFWEAQNVIDTFLNNFLSGNTIHKKLKLSDVLKDWRKDFSKNMADIQKWKQSRRAGE